MWQYEPICDSDNTLLIFRIKDIVLSCVFKKLFEKLLCQSEYTFMATLWNWAGHYTFALWFLLLLFFFA